MTMHDYKINEAGPLGKKIKDIISITDLHIVYLDYDDTIQWYMYECPDLDADFGEIQNKISDWEAKANKLFSKKDAYSIKCILAEAYARLLNKQDVSLARDIIERATERVVKQGREILRQCYIISSISFAILICLFIFASKSYRNNIIDSYGMESYTIWMTMLFGGIGAFIFTIIRARSYKPDILISKFVHVLDGLLRVFYGIIAGLVIAIAIKSNLVLGFLNQYENSVYISVFLGICAGASEILIPSLIKQVESMSTE